MGKQILSVTKQVNGRLEVSGLWCELRLCFNSVRAVRSVVSGALRHMDGSLRGLSVHGIFQARTLEWVATPSSRDLPSPGTGPASPALASGLFTTEPPGELS